MSPHSLRLTHAFPWQEEGEKEDDYMASSFVGEGAAAGGAVDPRHSMPRWKRKVEVERRRERLEEEARKRPKPAEAERDQRARGLAQAIGAENKGFGMLMKMGFTPGQGLGKDSSGMSHPIAIEMKANGEGDV